MDEIVRSANSADVDQLSRLETIARAGIVGVRGGDLRLQECEPVVDWPMLLDDDDTVVLAGTIDDHVVAFLVLVMDVRRDRGFVSHVYVEVEARELGLGDAMVERAIEAVHVAGLSGIESVALPGDRETKNLFERAGMTARKLTVYKSLRTGTFDEPQE
ncbi:MAG: GNAT family N-acetyltransferase [Ilumatobacteraceae bacterium]